MASTFDLGPYDIVKPEDRQPVTLGDYWKQSWQSGVRDTNFQAETVNLREAFNATNEKIAKATGVADLVNPVDYVPGYTARRQTEEEQRAPYEKWKARVLELQQKHPDALPWDNVLVEPERTAYEKMKAIRDATGAMEERLGLYQPMQRPWLGIADKPVGAAEAMVKNLATSPVTWTTGFLAQFAAQSVSPEDAAVNFIPFFGGKAGRSLIKNAFANAGQNMIGQAALSFGKMEQYERAQLPHGWDQWWAEVSGAGAAGFVIDAGARGVARSYKTAVGKTEGMGGVFTDAPKPLPLPEAPKARPDIPEDLLKRAQSDDIEAIKEIARLTGVDQDPAVKGAIHYAETTGPVDEAIAKHFRDFGVDDGEGLRVLSEALRGGGRYVRPPEPTAPAVEPRMREAGERILLDREAELQGLIQGLDQRTQQRIVDAVEAGIPRVVNLVQERLDAAKGEEPTKARESLLAGLQTAADEMGGPERFAAMVDLYAGRGDVRTTAQAIRDFPDLVDSNLSTSSDLIQASRAISKLEPEAFALFDAGDVSPGVARAVADLVPPDQQARVMDDMRRAGIETETDAREAARDLVKPVRDASDVDTPLSRGSKIDDPAGPEAKAQTDRLMKEHAEAVKEAQAPIKAREKLESEIEDLRGQIAKLEEKAAKAAPAPVERYADPVSGMELSKGEVDSIVDMWAHVRETRKRKPETLTAFLISAGRLQDQGGELTNMLGGKSRHLISGKGMTLDDAALKAQQVGFFTERPDINTFLDAVREDLNGNPHVRDIDFNWLEDFREAQKMEQDLAELGVLKAKSEAEVRDAFRSKPEGEGAQGARGDQAPAGRAEGEAGQVIPEHLFALSSEDLAKIGELHAEVRDLRAQHLEASRGSPLFSLVMDAAAQQRSRDVRQAIGAALRLKQQILPDDVKVEVRADEMRDPTTGNRLDAMSDTLTGDIALAAYALNPAARLGHEAVHTLVTRGLLSPEEVSLLAKAAREAGAFTKEADYREAYKARADLDRLIEEEAAAHYIEAIIARRVEAKIPQNLVQKIQQIIERIRNALNGYGFRNETDVVRAIMEGDAAARRSVQAWMRSQDMSAIAVRKPEAMFALSATERGKVQDIIAPGPGRALDEIFKGGESDKEKARVLRTAFMALGFRDARIPASFNDVFSAEQALKEFRLVSEITGLRPEQLGQSTRLVFGDGAMDLIGAEGAHIRLPLTAKGHIRLHKKPKTGTMAHEWAHLADTAIAGRGKFSLLPQFASAQYSFERMSKWLRIFPRSVDRTDYSGFRPGVREALIDIHDAVRDGKKDMVGDRLAQYQDAVKGFDGEFERYQSFMKERKGQPYTDEDARQLIAFSQAAETIQKNFTPWERAAFADRKLKGAASYFSSSPEMFARGFEVYLAEKAKALGYEGDLVDELAKGRAKIRPTDAAFAQMVSGFDRLFAALRERPDNKLFAFAGEKAETANLDALARAQDLEAAGMDRDNIWKLTGWGRGADGKWRFEIDDSDAGFSAKASLRRKSGPMGERFEHPDLYEAYPALRALDLFWDPELDPKTSLGGFSPDTGVVSLAAKLPSQWTLPVTLHELQHGVQEMERFGRGASMGEMAVSPARVEGWLAGEDGQFLRGTYFERDITMSAAKVIDGFEGGDMLQLQAQVAALIQRGEITLEAAGRKIAQQMQTDAYVRNSGEVEARLVETRMDMTPEQRRERPFWYDYDVLQQEQDVRRRDMLFAMEDGRKARAEAMGFDTSFVAYRGLTHPYDPAVAGDRNWQMFTRSRDAASGYASDLDGANVVPAHLRLGKNLTIDAGGARWDRIPGKAIPYDVKVQARLPMDPVYSVGELARGLRRLGYDSITVANVIDTAHPDQAIVSTVDVVFDPRNIRSVNAEFDPAKADSPNLMYAMDAPRTPLQDDMEAIARLDAFKELVEACR